MATHIILDRTGDTRHEFDVTNALAVSLAEKRFKELMGRGFRAVALANSGGSGRLLREFDPQIDRTLFIPQLEGG